MAARRALLDLLECAGQLLREGTKTDYTSLTNLVLRELAATARALAASAEAEIEARSAPFPASLPPALVMQWLRLREVPAALRVARSWRDESEQYFRRFAQHNGVLRGDSWRDSVRCYMEWYRYGGFSDFQQEVFASYAKFWAKGDTRFKSIDEVAAAWRDDKHKYSFPPSANPRAYAEGFRRSLVSLVCFGKLNASPTGGGHRFDYQVEGLDDLTPLQLRVLKYHIVYSTNDEGCNVHDVAAQLGTDLSLVRAAVDFLEGEDYLNSTIDDDHHDYAFFPTLRQLTESRATVPPPI